MMRLLIQKYQWILVLLVAVVGGGFCMDLGHEWGDDFAMYLNQAQCWIGGGMDALYTANKACMDTSDGLLGPYLYPQGFPLFLSFFQRLFEQLGLSGLSLLYALKWANFGFFVLVLLAYLRLLNGVFEGHWGKIFLGFVLIAWHPKIWESADRLNSDLWFSALVILFFYALNTSFKGWLSRALTLSLLIFVASASRSNGVFLVAAWFVAEWVDFRKTGKAENRVVALMMGTMAGLFALYADAGNGSNHWQLLKEIEFSTIVHNLGVYTEMAGSFPYWHFATLVKLILYPVLWLLVIVFWGIVFVGFRVAGQYKWGMAVFVLLNFGLYIVWPSVQGMRFLFPLLPLLSVFFVGGLAQTWKSKISEWTQEASWLPGLFRNSQFVVVLGASMVLVQGAMTSVFYIKRDTNEAFSKDMRGVYDFVDEALPLGSRVSFHKPRLLRFVTGVESYRIASDYGKETVGVDESVPMKLGLNSALKKLQTHQMDFWILPKKQLVQAQKPALPIAFENEGFVIYKISRVDVAPVDGSSNGDE